MRISHRLLTAAALAAITTLPLMAATDAPVAAPAAASAPAQHFPADQPSPRLNAKSGKPDSGWMKHHDQLVEQAKKGGVDLYFEGDSITDFWTNPRRKADLSGIEVWNKEFSGWHPGDFGISGDRTEHVLWRMDNGELDGVSPKVVVLMIGTNNTNDCSGEEIASGVKTIVQKFRTKQPQARILLLAIFPRNDNNGGISPEKRREANDQANKMIATLDDGEHVKFLNINDKFPPITSPEFKATFPDLLHPNARGYQIWADAIKPTLTEWLGAPAATAPAEMK